MPQILPILQDIMITLVLAEKVIIYLSLYGITPIYLQLPSHQVLYLFHTLLSHNLKMYLPKLTHLVLLPHKQKVKM